MPNVNPEKRCKISVLLLTTILASGVAAPAYAQVAGKGSPPPVRRPLDENGVDVIRGAFVAPVAEVSIGGSGTHGLSYGLTTDGVTTTLGTIENVAGKIVVTIEGRSDSFTISGSNYVSEKGEGATLVLAAGTYIYTSRDGTEARFASNAGYGLQFYEGELARLGLIKYPDGSLKEFAFRVTTMCTLDYDPEAPNTCYGERYYVARLQSVRSSDGYQMRFNYAFNDTPAKVTLSNYGSWGLVNGVVAINQAVQFCDAVATSCSITGTWPSLTFGSGTVTDSLNRTTTYGGAGVTTPGGASIAATYNAGKVQSVTNAGVSYNYAYADAGNTRTTTVTAPDGGQKVYTGDLTTFLLGSFRDELYRTTSYQYDANGRVTRVTAPEGNYTQYTYDARGNATETRSVAKPGSGLADIVTTASYPATCTNVKTCNKPDWTRDAKGNQTDYTYNATHGGALTVTAPAASAGGTRPQTRYSYTPLNSYYKVGSNSITVGYAHQKLTGVSNCQTTASCAAAADEVKTTIGYGPQAAGTANNLLPITVTRSSGNNALTATATLAYDNIGNRITVNGPLAGTADTTRTRYDAARQVVGTVGPDPDGVGVRKHLAQRYSYNLNGQITNTETGNVNSQSDADWTAMTVSQNVTTTYDANARPTKQELKSGATSYAITDASYDALGRIDCTAQRMNPAVFSSLPSSACTPGTQGSGSGDFGPDRIVKSSYNLAGEQIKVQTAFGTSDQADEATTAYTTNGKVDYVIDAENNRTDYSYDGYDRGIKVEYPSAMKGANVANASDYEQLSYDANSNITSSRLRDGTVINLTYDNLNRVTAKDTPNVAHFDYDISYQYDLMGRMKTATTGLGHANNFTYDALGRMTVQQMYNTTTYNNFDAAGRRTRMTWADGNYADYDYDLTGNVTAIRENGATSGVGVLASYGYDNLGRRSSVTRGNTTVTSYAYDPTSRLSSLVQDLAGSAHDQTTTLGYNPAGQIDSLTKTNDIYAWNGHYNVDRLYGSNGLNQLTSAGATSLGHDARGNLTTSGSNSYGYTAENRMATAPSGNFIGYEPSGNQMLQYYNSGTGADTRYGWDRGQMSIEINASGWTTTRRYVSGPNPDETVVWYEGAGLSDRRWLHTDERGSVTAVTNSSGTAIAINTYDEYGIPAASNLGRFQYTGQAWLPEIGMYYYKARIYSPTLGRFMQTDPIGYTDGINWYNYVASDPVNNIDPTGLLIDVDYNAIKPKDGIIVNGYPPTHPCLACGNESGNPGATWAAPAGFAPGGSERPGSGEGNQEEKNCESSGVNKLVKNSKKLSSAVNKIRQNQSATEKEFGFEAQNNGRGGVDVGPIIPGVEGRVRSSVFFHIKNIARLNFGALFFHSHGPSYDQNLSGPDVSNGDGPGEAMTVLVTKDGLKCSRPNL